MFYKDISEQDYKRLHSDHNKGYGALTYSAAKRMTKCTPADAIAQRLKKNDKIGIGILLHELLFTPEVVDEKYVFAPYKHYTHDRKLKEETGKIRINETGSDSLDQAKQMVKCIENHNTAKQWLAGTTKEAAIFYKCPVTGISIKCRLDAFRDWGDGNYSIVDLKTTSQHHMRNIEYHIKDSLYDLQAAAFCEAVSVEFNVDLKNIHYVCVFIDSDYYVVDGQEIHSIKVVKFSQDSEIMNSGIEKWQEAKQVFSTSVDNDHFDDYPDELVIL